jgi:DNA-directed RNA polymerase specialized sigma subunit
MIGKYNTIFANLEEDKGREPTVTELADAMHVPQVEIERLQNEQRSDLHMEFPSDDDEAGGFHSYVMPETEDPALKQAINFVYFDSGSLDKKIIEYWFGYGGTERLSAKDLKKKLGLSETELRKRRKSISKQIRELM